MSGIIIIIISLLMLLIGIYFYRCFNILNNHTPFHKVEYIDYLFSGLGACLLIPSSIFGIAVGIMIFVD